jgi:hypothetical protein
MNGTSLSMPVQWDYPVVWKSKWSTDIAKFSYTTISKGSASNPSQTRNASCSMLKKGIMGCC